MARGVVTPAETQEEAERSVTEGGGSLRVLRSARLDLSDTGRVRRGTMKDNWWVLVVEWTDRGQPDPLPQHEDPEGESEATFRRDLLRNFDG